MSLGLEIQPGDLIKLYLTSAEYALVIDKHYVVREGYLPDKWYASLPKKERLYMDRSDLQRWKFLVLCTKNDHQTACLEIYDEYFVLNKVDSRDV